MISLQKALVSPRLMKALTGLTPSEFKELLPGFETSLKKHRAGKGLRWGLGRPHTLATIELKLFFALFYAKCYPTFDMASFIFDADRHRCHDWTKELLAALENTLAKKIVLPERKLSTPEEFFARFPGVKDVWIDGTERPIRRAQNPRRQKRQYSGKKKRHTVKNIIVSDRKKRILVITPTTTGKSHDYRELKRRRLAEGIPKKVRAWLDTGFQGIRKDFPGLQVRMPKRANRGHPLTAAQQKTNLAISRRRILVENAIGGVKRYRSLTDVFRNHTNAFADRLMLVGAGLWNFHLQQG